MSRSLKDPITGKRLTGAQRVALEIVEFRRKAKLDSWTGFVGELQVPADIYTALAANRPELMALARPRALSSDECAVLYKLICGLMETNAALRQHTARVAQLTDTLSNAMKGFTTAARSIHDFANFRTEAHDDENDAEDAAA